MPASVPMGDAVARLEAYLRYGSVTQASTALGMKPSRLHQWIRHNGYLRRVFVRRSWTTGDMATLRRSVARGMNGPQIARAMGRSLMSVRQFACENGISLEARHRWTPGQRRGVDRLVETAVSTMVSQLEVDEGAALSAIVRSCMRRRKRAKAANVADLGGMRVAV